MKSLTLRVVLVVLARSIVACESQVPTAPTSRPEPALVGGSQIGTRSPTRKEGYPAEFQVTFSGTSLDSDPHPIYQNSPGSTKLFTQAMGMNLVSVQLARSTRLP